MYQKLSLGSYIWGLLTIILTIVNTVGQILSHSTQIAGAETVILSLALFPCILKYCII